MVFPDPRQVVQVPHSQKPEDRFNGFVLRGSENPTTDGVRAPEGSIFQRDNGEVYVKTGSGITDWTNVISASVGSVESVTFSPGNPSPDTNVFTTWAAAHSAVSGQGGIRSIVIDTTFQSPAVIPAGSYDMENIILVGGLGPTAFPITALQIDDGVTLPNLREIQGPMTIDSRATAAVIAPTDSLDGIILENQVILTVTTGGAPFIAVPTAVGYEISLRSGSQIVNTAALEIVSVVGGGTVTARVNGESSNFSNDFLSGAGGTLAPVVEVGNPTAVGTTQSNFSGTIASVLYTAIPVWDLQGDSVNPITAADAGRPFTRMFYDPTGGTFQLDAPISPSAGTRWAVKNVSSSVIGITIFGSGNSIEDPTASFTLAASFSLVGDGIGVEWEFDGTNWLAV